jgi:hypothetical protein
MSRWPGWRVHKARSQEDMQAINGTASYAAGGRRGLTVKANDNFITLRSVERRMAGPRTLGDCLERWEC